MTQQESLPENPGSPTRRWWCRPRVQGVIWAILILELFVGPLLYAYTWYLVWMVVTAPVLFLVIRCPKESTVDEGDRGEGGAESG
jgi:hypothetical protein